MINELKNDINNGSINHAYFLECNDEKKGLEEARSFASEILGKSIDNNPDCTIFLTEEKTIKVESIRDLQKDVAIKPLMCQKKVYIIPYAEKLNISAQNCLLKTLEEPPSYAVIILISSSIYSVINTIRSRVKKIRIKSEDGIHIDSDVKNNWCIDGEQLEESTNKYKIEIDKNLKIMMPSKNVDKLFTKKWYRFK